MGKQKLLWVVWPAFLAACLLELVMFALVDPHELHWGGRSLELSRQTIYTFSFFVFWAISMLASSLTAVLAMPPEEINRCPFPPEKRPNDCPGR